jgi:hypothetical protein
MAVQKYKPKATPHRLEESLDRTATQNAQTVKATRDAIQRSRVLVAESRNAIEVARQLRRKRAS